MNEFNKRLGQQFLGCKPKGSFECRIHVLAVTVKSGNAEHVEREIKKPIPLSFDPHPIGDVPEGDNDPPA